MSTKATPDSPTPRSAAEIILDQARAIIACQEKEVVIRSRLNGFDSETARTVAEFEAQMVAAESANYQDVEGITKGLVLAEQKRRYIASRVKEREKLVAKIEVEIRAARVGVPTLQNLFSQALVMERNRVMTLMQTCWETEARANGAVNSCDSVNALARWPNLLRQMPREVVIGRLLAFVDGKVALWRI